MWPLTTMYIKTFRLPTPLLIFQLALIAGSILVGALLAPLLYLSRHIAQQPLRKLRFPEEKRLHRRLLALGFYFGAALIIGGLIGMWARWCLGGRDPWIWVAYWMLEGKKKWTRPLLLAYWGVLAGISVAAWGRQLSRSRRYRQKAALPPVTGVSTESALHSAQTQSQTVLLSSPMPSPPATASSQKSFLGEGSNAAPEVAGESSIGLQLTLPTLPALPSLSNLPNGQHVSAVATDLLDAADKRMPTLSLNSRRKFFHGLAVVMFIPGIAIDVSVTPLS